MITAFGEAWADWYGDETLEANLKKAHEKMQPNIKASKKYGGRRALPKKVTAIAKPAKVMQTHWARPDDSCMSWYAMEEDA